VCVCLFLLLAKLCRQKGYYFGTQHYSKDFQKNLTGILIKKGKNRI
jgi:hypothetical protein